MIYIFHQKRSILPFYTFWNFNAITDIAKNINNNETWKHKITIPFTIKNIKNQLYMPPSFVNNYNTLYLQKYFAV